MDYFDATLIDSGDYSEVDAWMAARTLAGALYRNEDEWLLVRDRGKIRWTSRLFGYAYEKALVRITQHVRGRPAPLSPTYSSGYLKLLDEYAKDFDRAIQIDGAFSHPAVHFEAPRPVLPPGNAVYDKILWAGRPFKKRATTNHLLQLFSGMSFDSETDRANLYGWLIASFARPSCPSFPLLVIDGFERNVGKTTVARAISQLVVDEIRIEGFTPNERELEKRLGGYLNKPGPSFVFFDNVKATAVTSQIFAIAVTSPSVYIRPNYGKKSTRLDYPLFVLSMNKAAVEHDLHDRCITVQVRSQGENHYFDPHPFYFAKEHRTAIIEEIMGVLFSLDLDQAPTRGSRHGRFEDIARLSAKYLGMTADYSAPLHKDNLVREIQGAWQNEAKEDGFVSLPAMADHIFQQNITSRGVAYQEIAAEFRHRHAHSTRMRSAELRKIIQSVPERAGLILDKDNSGTWRLTM